MTLAFIVRKEKSQMQMSRKMGLEDLSSDQ